MKNKEIENLANSLDWKLERIETIISPINKQIDQLKLYFKDDEGPTFTQIGNLLDGIENLIIDDQYGDLTGLTLEYTTYHTINDEDDDINILYTITFNIDS